MTYGANTNEPVSFVQRIFASIADFFNSLVVRLIVIFVIGSAVAGVVADFAYPVFVSGFANHAVVELAQDNNKRLATNSEILQTINRYNLSWYYVTTSDGKIVPATKPYAPTLNKYGIAPRKLEWKGKQYYEATESLSSGQILHIGVYAGPILLPNIGAGELLLAVPMYAGFAVLILFGLFIFTVIALQLWVGKPLIHLARACYSLLLSREAYSHITGGGLNVSGAVTEVQEVSKGLRDIRKQYDEAVVARAVKTEELKRAKTEHQEEKTFIAKQYEDQLAQSEQRITELHTKEAEEEFLNALSRELDLLKSSKQVYHRVLEKLNDKYPTSIVFGAFFKIDDNMRASLETNIGFGEKSIQALIKLDHGSIVRQIFSTGQYLVIGTHTMRDYGFQQLAQVNGIKSIVCLPVRFQNRNLGMFAFYFTQEGHAIQERLRILRNVIDLTARVLYQVVMYEEETEASRTDPLTGLRNKKYFYEIMPQIFARASVKPEANPISFIMIDGDHFKSINDTYGHQVGDQMLQEVAKTIKQCVRTQDYLSGSAEIGDYLVRYGGEEFVVAMEMTGVQKAIAVAERIRTAIESKTDWPGGIVKWTVSLGVSTYPNDARDAELLLTKADTALYYVKEEMGRNKVCHCEQVPRTFKSKKSAAAIGGELGVFDAAGLLQSIASSQKTGVLTVQAGDGKQLWMLFEVGKPIQARLGKMIGNAAITEFLVTFEEGSFNFKELVYGAGDVKLPKLDDSHNVTRSIERALMDGALAQDNYNAARTIISSSDICLLPIAKDEYDLRWNTLTQLEDPPSPDEFYAMTEITKRSTGDTMLTQIFKQLEPMPIQQMWRGAALLVQHNLVEVKQR